MRDYKLLVTHIIFQSLRDLQSKNNVLKEKAKEFIMSSSLDWWIEKSCYSISVDYIRKIAWRVMNNEIQLTELNTSEKWTYRGGIVKGGLESSSS